MLEFALVRLIEESPVAVYVSDLHRMIEERIGFDVPMHQFMHRLLKLAHQGRIRSRRESQPPYRQLFMPPDTVLDEEQIEAASLPLSEVERLRIIREIELCLESSRKDG